MCSHPRLRRARRPGILLLALFSTLLSAQPSNSRPPPPLGEKTLEAFGRLKSLQDAKDWDGMLRLLDAIPGVRPESYDEAIILDTKAKIHAAREQPARALTPWERALELGDRHGYFSASQTLEIVGYLAQLYAQEAIAAKEPTAQRELFGKSLGYFRRLFEKTPKPTPDLLLTYASLLFHRATAMPTQIDQEGLKEARAIVDQGLLLSVKPKDGFYQMRLALLQQEGDFAGASDLIELLLSRKTDNKDYWQALVAIYQQLAFKAQESDPTLSREYLVRAIVSFERAQALGFLTGPKENLARASLYLSAKQFTRGTELLRAGLQQGTIESEPNTWRLLGRFYQETNQLAEARAALEEAAGLFPQLGEIEMQLAHLCLQLEDNAAALQHAQAAAAKGHFETTKPFSVYYLIAYTAFDLGRLAEAAAAIATADAFPEEATRDPQFAALKTMVAETLADAERKARERAGKPATATGAKSGG
jgi:hypothetical protein